MYKMKGKKYWNKLYTIAAANNNLKSMNETKNLSNEKNIKSKDQNTIFSGEYESEYEGE